MKSKVKTNKKLKIALIGLTSCEGCQFAILDLGEKILDVFNQVDLVEFRLLEEEPDKSKKYDICFIEGAAITKEQIKFLKYVRRKTKTLVALGNCAALGGVWEIKNYHDKEKTIRYIYRHHTTVPNPDIEEIDKYVEVDFVLPGCPINADEFLSYIKHAVEGVPFEISNSPVCLECQQNKNECLLQKGKICFGPVTRGGCNAVCLNSNQGCYACRGLLENANYQSLYKTLRKNNSDKQINLALEMFGVRDDWEENFKKSTKKK